jgi:hypothetical protein
VHKVAGLARGRAGGYGVDPSGGTGGGAGQGQPPRLTWGLTSTSHPFRNSHLKTEKNLKACWPSGDTSVGGTRKRCTKGSRCHHRPRREGCALRVTNGRNLRLPMPYVSRLVDEIGLTVAGLKNCPRTYKGPAARGGSV